MEDFLLFESRKVMAISSYKGIYKVESISDFSLTLKTEINDGDFLMLDSTVADLYEDKLKETLNRCDYMNIDPSEQQKSYQLVEPLIERLINKGFKKNNRLVAIGGGITQDITAFIASILYRGVEWLFIPTTLLAQADSCIGSKTSINFGLFKNQVGGFYPPKLIFLDHSFLKTLSPLDIRSGMGEIMHYYIISGWEDINSLKNDYDCALNDLKLLSEIAWRSLHIKKNMVEIDEFDTGPRNIFNYGHTFGHALESYTDYVMPHGIAVSFGMDIANWLSVKLGFMSEDNALVIRDLLMKNCLPCIFPKVIIDDYVMLLNKDKKHTGKTLRFVLANGPGSMFLHSMDDYALLSEILNQCFDYYYALSKEYI